MPGHTPDEPETIVTEPDTPDVDDTGQVGEVLGQVRGEAIRLLEEVPQPRALRVQAGEVTVDMEWATHPPAAASVPPASVQETGQPDDTEPDDTEPDAAYLGAPAVGVFYRAPEPGAEPFVAEGDTVSAGQQVAIVEAMKLMIPVEADQPGRIAKVLKNNAEPVEYGERLFLLDPEPDEEDKP